MTCITGWMVMKLDDSLQPGTFQIVDPAKGKGEYPNKNNINIIYY